VQQQVVDFFNHPFFIIVGGLTTSFAILSFAYLFFLILKGILPVWYRLGLGLAKRSIAIFAECSYEELRSLLVDSKIFRNKKIIRVGPNEIKSAAKTNVFLISWDDMGGKIDEILNEARDDTAVIVYAKPQDIDPDSMKKINALRNAVVVNLRGRLLNDILTTMITSGFHG
jgi:hypothetical protein